ncbi:MAG: late competence development ComFB family protein [Candidatus Edwardsbacteria bacterium]
MKFQNYMEIIVEQEIERVLRKRTDVCKCELCQLDIMAHALSHLTPRYIVTDVGHAHTMLDVHRGQLIAEATMALLKAIDAVSKKPRHPISKE